ncbi:MAG TPA: helix-turn-helix transcriptional regulator [Lachnospiraceae bacterium]|nr:helix-turn-helix transcriptional regulator [Lachnospiraceae bacterium]
MSYLQIGIRIRELREVQHYSREGLAEKVKISSKFLYEIEVGRKGFSADTLSRLARSLSVSCDYIMYGEEQEKYHAEKIVSVLEMLDSKQTSRMHEIVEVLYEICNTL